MSRSCPPGDC